MRQIITLLAIVVLITTPPVLAQCPQGDPDNLCIVFDYPGDCCQNCWPPDPSTIPYTGELAAHVVLQNPSAAGGVLGFQFWLCDESGLLFEPPFGCMVTGYTLPPGAINVCPEPKFVVGLTAPLPWASCILLVSVEMIIACWDCWCLGAMPDPMFEIPEPMLYADGGDPGNLIYMYPCTSSGWADYQMACVNCDYCPPGPPLAIEEASWGHIKELYR
jgi:hypothetical protein